MAMADWSHVKANTTQSSSLWPANVITQQAKWADRLNAGVMKWSEESVSDTGSDSWTGLQMELWISASILHHYFLPLITDKWMGH